MPELTAAQKATATVAAELERRTPNREAQLICKWAISTVAAAAMARHVSCYYNLPTFRSGNPQASAEAVQLAIEALRNEGFTVEHHEDARRLLISWPAPDTPGVTCLLINNEPFTHTIGE